MSRPGPEKGTRKIQEWLLRAILAVIAAFAVVLVLNVARDRRALLEVAGDGGPGETDTAHGPGGDVEAGRAPAPPSLFGAAAGSAAPPESIGTSEAVFRKASPSVVVVKIFRSEDKRLRSQGSGVAVASETVVTNRHVVESGGEIRVTHQGQDYAATVLYADREYDLCALAVPGLPAPSADTASVETIRAGQRVYAIGAPRGLELSISGGLVSAVRPYGAFPLIQTDAPISKGSSGGGLFDTDGRLVGVTTSSAIDGQNINFALAADLISRLPARSADIRSLDPIVPVRRAEEIMDKALLDSLREGRRSIAAVEAELTEMAGEIDRQGAAMTDWKRTMDGCLSSNDTKTYNEMVPRYNRLGSDRNELVKRFEGKRREHAALVERYNRAAQRHNGPSRPMLDF